MVGPINKAKVLEIQDWPVYMWVVSLVYLSLTIWAFTKLQEFPKYDKHRVWWRFVIAFAFCLILFICLYIGKYEKLHLVASEEDDSFLIQNRALIFNTYSRFSVGHIVNVKVKESGKSTKNYCLEMNIVDGRHFTLFDSGIKEKTLRKQFMIRRFIEEYFQENHTVN